MKRFFLAALLLLPTLSPAATLSSPFYHLSTGKVVVIAGEITPDMVDSVFIQMKTTESLPGPRLVLIRSPGGDVQAGMQIEDMLQKERSQTHQKLVCVAIDGAHSMAFNIMTSCDVRLATSGTTMVAHRIAMGGPTEDMPRLTSKNLRKIAEDIDKTDAYFDALNAKALHLSKEEYSKIADKEKRWTAKELVDRHYLAGIVEVGP